MNKKLTTVTIITLAITFFIFPIWYRIVDFQLISTIFLSLISWLWISILFISVVNLWQEKDEQVLSVTSYIICLSITLSGFWMLVFYPAVMSIDALGHWQQALNNEYSKWHPPILAMLMHITQYFVESPSLFSFIQGTLFWAAIFYLIQQISINSRLFLINSSFMVLLPSLWLYSNATVSNTWTATFVLLTLAFLIQAIKKQSNNLFALSLIALSLGVMFRRETILLLPILIFFYIYFVKQRESYFSKIVGIFLMIIIVLLPGQIIELSPRILTQKTSPISHGIFNQYVGTIYYARNSMKSSEFLAEKISIDQEFGTGTFQKLLNGYVCHSGDYIVWDLHLPAVIGQLSGNKKFIVGKAIQTAIRHPLGYLKHQGCYFAALSQFSMLQYQSWGILDLDKHFFKDERRTQLGIEYKSKLPLIEARYRELVNTLLKNPKLSLFFRHYIFLIILSISLILGLLYKRVELLLISLVGLVYPLGYLIVSPAALWRYLLPTYLCSWICLIAIFNSLILLQPSIGKSF